MRCFALAIAGAVALTGPAIGADFRADVAATADIGATVEANGEPVGGDPGPSAESNVDVMTDAQSTDDTSVSGNDAASVAAVVEQDFPTYDTDARGGLNRQEFTAWMTALHVDSSGDAEATQAWAEAAFAAADIDDSEAISKAELSRFLIG